MASGNTEGTTRALTIKRTCDLHPVASLTSPSIKTLYSGSFVTSLGAAETGTFRLKNKNWCFVRSTDGIMGYVLAVYTNGVAGVDFIQDTTPPGARNEKNIPPTKATTENFLTGYGAVAAPITDATPKVVLAKTDFNKSIVYKSVVIPPSVPTDAVDINKGGEYPDKFSPLGVYGKETNPTGRFKMIVYTADKAGKTSTHIFTMTVSPQSYSQTMGNAVAPIKTGGGYVLMRTGPQLSEMSISGVLLDNEETDERRSFLSKFYDEYLADKVNAFHEYFSESRLVFELGGYKYEGILTSLQLMKNAVSLYTYTYTMSIIIVQTTKISANKQG